jgi:endonuclease YncB( thermonuclease family)
MPMLCVAGNFRIAGTEPDGDSVRFFANDPAQWSLLPGPNRVRTNAHGGAQLRLDGIDALETHYSPQGGGPVHQPLEFAHKAGAELLRWLGFRNVIRDAETVSSAEPDQIAGYVLTRGADLYGRCVALAGRGDPPFPSDSSDIVTITMLRRTANTRLLATGLAFPTFYSKLFPDLRNELADQAAKARGKGLWPTDQTQSGTNVETLGTLTDDAVVLPKLFRRLIDYLHLNASDPSLAGFKTYLAQRDDRLYIISTAHHTGFDFVVDVKGQTVRLTVAPEDLIFDER